MHYVELRSTSLASTYSGYPFRHPSVSLALRGAVVLVPGCSLCARPCSTFTGEDVGRTTAHYFQSVMLFASSHAACVLLVCVADLVFSQSSSTAATPASTSQINWSGNSSIVTSSCPENATCSRLSFACWNCDYNDTCTYGDRLNVTCSVSPEVATCLVRS